jgi:3-phenylpropionate/cinnamic acid dioxygenase small subunit
MTTQIEQNLRDIEEIRILKARYTRYGDEHKWEEFASLLTEDVEFIFDVLPRKSQQDPISGHVQGRDVFLANMPAWLEGVVTVHTVSAPEIILTGPNEAEGVWRLHDYVQMPECTFNGYGHYHEKYVKEGGAWKIKRSHTTRLRYDEVWRFGTAG